jgi:DNA-binding NarL/FixJ family response regulator
MPDSPAKALFTPRELQIVLLMVEEGLNTVEIAQSLGITESGVRQRIKSVREKIRIYLGYSQISRSRDVVLFAVTHNLVDMRTIIDRYSPVRLQSQSQSEPVSA